MSVCISHVRIVGILAHLNDWICSKIESSVVVYLPLTLLLVGGK